MKIGKLYSQGSIKGNIWEKIYETTLSSAQTSITISNLDGNSAEEYLLETRCIGGADNSTTRLLLNNDSDSNYGYQQLFGEDTTINGSRSTSQTGINLSTAVLTGNIGQSKTLIYAKSGYVRTAISRTIRDITGTTVHYMQVWGWAWNNDSDNITSLVLSSSQTSGLGIGTYISLFKKADKV